MKFYTSAEVAEMLQQDVQVIRRKLARGELKGYKDRDWLITDEDILEYTKGIPTENLMLIKDFAKIVRRDVKTIRDRVIEGTLIGVKLGKLWYADKNEISKFCVK